MTPPRLRATRPDGRTYVAFRWLRDGWTEAATDELTALLRVRRASACRPALLIEALAADGARGRGRDAPARRH